MHQSVRRDPRHVACSRHIQEAFMPRTLVVYYSRTRTTAKLAEQIGRALGADVEAIVDHAHRSGLLGWLRCGYEGTRRRLAKIGPALHDPADYDVVVIGTPIWSRSVSSPARAYLRLHRASFRNVAFFCTCGGSGSPQTFAQMRDEAGLPPIATLVVRQSGMANAREDVERFVRAIERAFPHRPDAAGDTTDRAAPRHAHTR
jgi:flavodoxin